jgi:hypothetical protein
LRLLATAANYVIVYERPISIGASVCEARSKRLGLLAAIEVVEPVFAEDDAL